MAEIAAAENQSYLPGGSLVCDKKADPFDHDPRIVLDLGKSGKRISKQMK